MKHTKPTKSKVHDKIAILESRFNRDPQKVANAASQELNKANQFLTASGVIAPLILSILYSIFPMSLHFPLTLNTLIDLGSTVLFIVVFLALLKQVKISQDVVFETQASTSHRNAEIKQLRKSVQELKSSQSLYITAVKQLGEQMSKGKTTIESLIMILSALMHCNVSVNSEGDNITFNFYELRNETIKMLFSGNRQVYCTPNSVDNPRLYDASFKQNAIGLNINDKSIRNYYCIKCIKGDAPCRNGCFILSDWKAIAEAFIWSGWTSDERDIIISENNREKCIDFGFVYNQYIGFSIRRKDGTTIFVEVIANHDTTLTTPENPDLLHVATQIKSKFTPLVNVLWDIYYSNSLGGRSEENG